MFHTGCVSITRQLASISVSHSCVVNVRLASQLNLTNPQTSIGWLQRWPNPRTTGPKYKHIVRYPRHWALPAKPDYREVAALCETNAPNSPPSFYSILDVRRKSRKRSPESVVQRPLRASLWSLGLGAVTVHPATFRLLRRSLARTATHVRIIRMSDSGFWDAIG